MKTRIGYVKRLSDKLKGYTGVIFEDTPETVHIECPPEWCATDTIDGVEYAPFPRHGDKYEELHKPRPDLEVGDVVITKGGRKGVITQITLGKRDQTDWYVSLDNNTYRYHANRVTKVEQDPTPEAPQNFTVTINAEDLGELELLARTLSEAITDVFDKERELRNAKETLSKFMEEIQK